MIFAIQKLIKLRFCMKLRYPKIYDTISSREYLVPR
jgi:hypothetical protein